MITYKNSNNAEKYTVLFRKASAKLGLMPIIKEVLLPNGEKDYEYYTLKVEFCKYILSYNKRISNLIFFTFIY